MKIFKKIFNNQKGAMFGLDARIALAIFSGLTVIAGVSISSKISSITGGALVDEVKKIGLAVEGLHLDMKTDIYKVLDNPTETTAFTALYDSDVLNPGKPRARWLGPYVEFRSNMHPSYGEMFVYKRSESYKEVCRAGSICYLWLVMDYVPIKVIEHVNTSYDGRSENIPEVQGRVQWENGRDEDHVNLWFRIGKSL